jgi:hypothetical protein
MGFTLSVSLPRLDVRHVQRAFNQRQQMLAAALDHVDGLLAVRGHGGVFAHQLRITQDAVERRAQLVADGADVAALGLVGLLGLRLACSACSLPWPACRASSVWRCDSISCISRCVWRLDSSCATWRLLCASTSHQATMPPSNQQRHIGLEEARAQRVFQRSAGRPVASVSMARQFLVVQHAKHRGQQRHDDEHEQNEVAQPRVQIRPCPFGQQPAQRTRPLRRQRWPGACTGRHSARPACSTASRSAPGRRGNGPCRGLRIRARKSRTFERASTRQALAHGRLPAWTPKRSAPCPPPAARAPP